MTNTTPPFFNLFCAPIYLPIRRVIKTKNKTSIWDLIDDLYINNLAKN